jgi:hypothetical protein
MLILNNLGIASKLCISRVFGRVPWSGSGGPQTRAYATKNKNANKMLALQVGTQKYSADKVPFIQFLVNGAAIGRDVSA